MSEQFRGVEVIDEKPQDACGVVGIWMPEAVRNGDIGLARLAVAGMHGIQHRGYDGAGVFVIDPDHGLPFVGNKGEGIISMAIPDGGYHLDKVIPDARMAVGHVRYGTNKSGGFDATQPFHKDELVLSDNGHVEEVWSVLEAYGIDSSLYPHDSIAKAALLHHVATQTDQYTGNPKGILSAIHEVAPQLEGAFSWVIATKEQLIGVRDSQGHRPLMVGHFEDRGGFMLASEQGALREAGADFIRDIEPGEVISISDDGISSTLLRGEQNAYGGPCVMEYLYFARPDGNIQGKNVYAARKALGRASAIEHPVDADIVVGIPETGVHSAVGYAEESGIRLAQGIFRNPNATRSFMQPTQQARAQAVRRKLWPNPEEIAGQRLVLIDDTVVRGTTTKEIISMLYNAGAQEIHVRVPSAPLRNPCFQGIDIGDPTALLARRQGSVEAMREVLGVDSLAFLSVEGMRAAISSVREVSSENQSLVPLPERSRAALLNLSLGRLCSACMDGNYPIKVPSDTIVLPELK